MNTKPCSNSLPSLNATQSISDRLANLYVNYDMLFLNLILHKNNPPQSAASHGVLQCVNINSGRISSIWLPIFIELGFYKTEQLSNHELCDNHLQVVQYKVILRTLRRVGWCSQLGAADRNFIAEATLSLLKCDACTFDRNLGCSRGE